MPRTPLERPRRRLGRRAGIVAGAVVALMIVGISAANAEPAASLHSAPNVPADGHPSREKDNRPGHANPSQNQQASAARFATVRWNEFGTPSSIGPAMSLASGLGQDPATAAREFLTRNQDVFGVDEAAVAAMDVLSVSPIGTASVVLLRQRFGALPAGHDGLAAVLVQNGTALRVTSSLVARHQRARAGHAQRRRRGRRSLARRGVDREPGRLGRRVHRWRCPCRPAPPAPRTRSRSPRRTRLTRPRTRPMSTLATAACCCARTW